MTASVGIALVAHSADLAAGVAALLAELGSQPVTVAAAGGDDEGGIGTSYAKVADAVARADTGAGAVVLADLGSSVLTARMVLDDREDLTARFVDAPFVEGAVAAKAAASADAALSAVAAAAEEAWDYRKE